MSQITFINAEKKCKALRDVTRQAFYEQQITYNVNVIISILLFFINEN